MKRKIAIAKNNHIKPETVASDVKPQRRKSKGKAKPTSRITSTTREFVIFVRFDK